MTGLDTGANDYLTKPFSTAELMARIRAMTRSQTGNQVTSRLTLGNITLDQTTFELSSTYGSFRLANKEYQMMELLLRNPRQLIPTERFLERIWGYDSEVELNVVWVYISYLRKKLSALKADIQIKATRNACSSAFSSRIKSILASPSLTRILWTSSSYIANFFLPAVRFPTISPRAVPIAP